MTGKSQTAHLHWHKPPSSIHSSDDPPPVLPFSFLSLLFVCISVALDTMISSAIDLRTWSCLHRYQPSPRALEQMLRIRMLCAQDVYCRCSCAHAKMNSPLKRSLSLLMFPYSLMSFLGCIAIKSSSFSHQLDFMSRGLRILGNITCW